MDAEHIGVPEQIGMTARQVFGEPVVQGGVTVIPAAAFVGGGGNDQGWTGFGGVARPLGAFVIEDGRARWVPAVDVSTLAISLGAAVAVFSVVRAIRRRRARKALQRESEELRQGLEEIVSESQ